MNAETRNDKKPHHRRRATNDRGVAMTQQPHGRHGSIGVRKQRKFAEVIHQHPECKYKSQSIQDWIASLVVVGVQFARHECQTPNEYLPCAAVATRRRSARQVRAARKRLPLHTNWRPAVRASGEINRPEEYVQAVAQPNSMRNLAF